MMGSDSNGKKTWVKVVAALVILAVALGIWGLYYYKLESYPSQYSGVPISIPAGQTAEFVYNVKKGSSPDLPSAGREIEFFVVPETAGTIVSITDNSGRLVSVEAKSVRTQTDPGGAITIVVRGEVQGRIALRATDVLTGRSEQSLSTVR